jgi:hypothetical protein
VDLETLDTQGLLDPHDESLEFVRKREHLRPMAIYRIHNDFLLCYDGTLAIEGRCVRWMGADVLLPLPSAEFAFYVNKNGRRSRKNFMVHWEGTPTGFGKDPLICFDERGF